MRNRQNRVEFYLSDEELDRLNQMAQLCGRSKSSWIRSVIMGYQLCEKPDAAFYQSMRELARFGSNLNQLTAKANALNFIDTPALRKEIAEWQDFRKAIFAAYLEPRKGK